MLNDDALYSNYIRREPHPRYVGFIRRWHRRLLSKGLSTLAPMTIGSVLEVGPGHGYFAEHCREQVLNYEFVDTSPAVFDKMGDLGFHGHLGTLESLSTELGLFDMIWMSHVLEHAPSWVEARSMVKSAVTHLKPGGALIVVSPDLLSWRREFWNADWSHGYPTTVRITTQLLDDVGLDCTYSAHHRNAQFSVIGRGLMALLCLVPHRLIDRVLTPSRYKTGDGFVYSWKAVFGWRQIFVCGLKKF